MRQRGAERIMETLREMGLKRTLIVDPISIYHLTGMYTESLGRFYVLYLRKDEKHVCFLNKLLTVPEDVGVERVWYSDTDPAAEIVAGYLDKENLLGAGKDLRARFLLSLMEVETTTGFISSSIAVDRIRGAKDEEGQDKMRTVSDISDKAIAMSKTLIHEGVTGCQIVNQMFKIYMDLGADDFSSEPLVALGASTVDPHHGLDSTTTKPGDLMSLGVGCIKDGYCSDATHTFHLRKASDEHRRIHGIARSANEIAISKICLGVPLYKLGGAARDLTVEQEYGPSFTYGSGHSTGLGEHESGDMPPVNTQKAELGMILSIEPGIYLPEDIGVRVEDPVPMTEDGCEVFNHHSREFEIIDSSATG